MRAGAEVRFEVTVTGLLRDTDGIVTGVEARDGNDQQMVAHAPITIGADGIRSRVARDVGALTYGRAGIASGMVAGYWSGIDVDGYQWFYAPGEAAGLIPTNDGLVCAWVATSCHRFLADLRQRADHGYHDIFRRVAPDWAEALPDAELVEPLRVPREVEVIDRISHLPLVERLMSPSPAADGVPRACVSLMGVVTLGVGCLET